MSDNVKGQGENAPISGHTSDFDWARAGLGFELGVSTWRERVAAIVRAHGSVPKAATAMDVPPDTVKTWLKKGRDTKAPRELEKIAARLALSIEYLATGRPGQSADFDIEHQRLTMAKAAFVPTGTSTARRAILMQLIDALRTEIDRRRGDAGSGFLPAAAPQGLAGLDDSADTLFAPPALTTTLGLPGLKDQEAAPIAWSREWLARQRLDPAQLGLLELGRSLYLVDVGQPARQLADGCTYVVHDTGPGRFVLCRWSRDARTLTLTREQPWELDPSRQPDAIVGRVVYAVTPM